MTKKGRRPVIWLALFMIVGVAVPLALGTWQLSRRAWKEDLIAAAVTRAHAAPAVPPSEAEWPFLHPAAVEYRRVTVKGSFQHENEIRVFTHLPDSKGPARGTGAWVLTPLVTESGATIIINRGFVPASYASPSTRAYGNRPGPETITGLIRWSEARTIFTPSDDPDKDLWYTRDPQMIAVAKNLPRVAPFFIDAETSPSGGWPQGGLTRLSFPNRHLEYALTWYSLAGAFILIFGLLLRRMRKAVA